jgi:hypothetical protein
MLSLAWYQHIFHEHTDPIYIGFTQTKQDHGRLHGHIDLIDNLNERISSCKTTNKISDGSPLHRSMQPVKGNSKRISYTHRQEQLSLRAPFC